MNKSNRIIYLLNADRHNTLSLSEKEELRAWLLNPVNEGLYIRLKDPENVDAAMQELLSYDVESNFEAFLAQVAQEEQLPVKRTRSYKQLLPYAASVAVFITFLLYLFIEKEVNWKEQDIPPGKSFALLTLSDGTIVDLNDEKAAVFKESGVEIITDDGGLVVYKITDSGAENPNVFHKISTTRGGQYAVLLPDGSKVWLNSETSLEYSLNFVKNRKVKLKGEAYFDITKREVEGENLQPFTINVSDQEVEVLGTQLNVQAYENEDVFSTTLVTGAVKIHADNNSVLLKPGEQAVLERSSDKLYVKKVNVREFSDWKDGYFYFENENIKQIMSKISRWYDIEVIYKGEISTEGFGGEISKYENIKELLNVLELTGKVRLQLEGRRVVVSSL